MDKDSFSRVKSWVKELRKMANKNIVMAIAGNKSDMDRLRKVDLKDSERWGTPQPYMWTSFWLHSFRSSAQFTLCFKGSFLLIGVWRFDWRKLVLGMHSSSCCVSLRVVKSDRLESNWTRFCNAAMRNPLELAISWRQRRQTLVLKRLSSTLQDVSHWTSTIISFSCLSLVPTQLPVLYFLSCFM